MGCLSWLGLCGCGWRFDGVGDDRGFAPAVLCRQHLIRIGVGNVIRRKSPLEGPQLAHQAAQLQLLEPFRQGRAIHFPQGQPGLAGQGDVHQDLRQHAGAVGVLLVGRQFGFEGPLEGALAVLLTGKAFKGGVDAVEGPVLLQQGDGRLRAHPLHAGDVVAGVAGEGLEVHHLLGADAEFGDHPVAPDQGGPRTLGVGAAAHVEHGDVALVVHELEQVAVAGENPHPPAASRRPGGQGAEHVVGLVARRHAEGQIHGSGQDLLQGGQVGEEVLGRLVAVGLVGRIRLVTEGGFGGVEGDHHALGGEAAAVVEQGLEEAVGHAGGNPRLGAQPPIAALGEGVKTAEGQGMAIHQQQQGPPKSFGLSHRS